jgi:hypothetical protein
MPIHVTTSTTQSLSNKTFVDRVSTTGVVYASSGNSNQWSSTYSSFNAASGKYDSTYTTVSSNSAKWQNTYTTVSGNSAYWDSTYNTVYTTSGSWNYQGADIKALTANWQNTYTTVSGNSAKYDSTYTTISGSSAYWDSTYNTVYTTSGAWKQTLSFDENTALLSILSGNTVSLSALSSIGGGGGVETDPIFTTWAQSNSARYDSTYSTVNTISGKLILGQIGIAINGGVNGGAGSVITTGIKQYLRVPYDCTITSYEVVVNPPGLIQMDIFKSTFETFPPTTSIKSTIGYPVSLGPGDGGIRRKDTSLSNWTTTLTAGQYLGFSVTSADAVSAATLTLTTLR